MKIDEYKQMMSFLLNPKHIHHGTEVVPGVPYVPKGYANGGRIKFSVGGFIENILKKSGTTAKNAPLLKKFIKDTYFTNKEDPNLFKAIIKYKDEVHGGNLSRTADDLDIDRKGMQSAGKVRGYDISGSGNTPSSKLKDMDWGDLKFTDIQDKLKEDSNYLRNLMDEKGIDVNQFYNREDLAKIFNLTKGENKKNRYIDQLLDTYSFTKDKVGSSTGRWSNGKVRTIDDPVGNNYKLYHLEDIINNFEKDAAIKNKTLPLNDYRDLKSEVDPDHAKVLDNYLSKRFQIMNNLDDPYLKQFLTRNPSKDINGVFFDYGHPFALDNYKNFDIVKNNPDKFYSISRGVMQDPYINQKILTKTQGDEREIARSIDDFFKKYKGKNYDENALSEIENINKKSQELYNKRQQLIKDWLNEKNYIGNDKIENGKKYIKDDKTRLEHEPYLEGQENTITGFKINAKPGEKISEKDIQAFGKIDPKFSFGNIQQINPEANVFKDLTPEQQKQYKQNMFDQGLNYSNSVLKQSGIPSDVIENFNDNMYHGNKELGGKKSGKEVGPGGLLNEQGEVNFKKGGRVHLKDGTQKYDIKDFIPNFNRDPIEDFLVNSIITSNDPKEVDKLYDQYKHYKSTYSGYGDYLKKTASQLSTPEGAGYLLSKGLKGGVEGTEYVVGQALRTLGGVGEYDPSKSVYENLLYEPVAGEKLGLDKLIEKFRPKNELTGTKALGNLTEQAAGLLNIGDIALLNKLRKPGIESLKGAEEIKDLLDPSKRDTLKIGAGIGAGAALSPIAKMLGDLEKITPKKAPLLKVMKPLGETKTQFPEWFPSLINRIRKEGEMTPIYRTEKIPITDEEFMQKIKKGEGKDVYVNPRTEEYFRQNPNEYPYYKIKKTDDIIGYEYTDKNLPDVKVTEYGGEEANVHFKNHYSQPVEINYKRPSFNNKGEFAVKDSVPEPGTGFEDVPDFEQSHVNHLDEVLGGTGNLEKYATRSNKYRATKGEAIVDEANARAEAEADRIKDEESYGE